MQGTAEPREGTLLRAIAILEFVATAGSSTVKEISEATDLPVPTVYRIAAELCHVDYLVHLKKEKRFALGYRLHQLAVGLHNDLGIAPQIKRELAALHVQSQMAAYLAVHRGSDFVVVHVADSEVCRRIEPMSFGFRDCPHATAFGKLGLAELSPAERAVVLDNKGMPALTHRTLTSRSQLDNELDSIKAAGIAWEHEEFKSGVTCAAVPIRSGAGHLLGTVAVSAPSKSYNGRETHIEHLLRSVAGRVGRFYMLGSAQPTV